MKEKIFLFVIGVLIGAVIATGAFYVYTTTSNNCNCTTQNSISTGNEPPEMPKGENGQNSKTGTPPEKPGEATTQNSN